MTPAAPDDASPEFEHSILINAAPTRVLAAFFEPHALAAWWQVSRSVTTQALEETEEAIQTVLEHSQPVDLTPQNSYIRRLQHQLAERYNLSSRSTGRDPYRHVRIYKTD